MQIIAVVPSLERRSEIRMNMLISMLQVMQLMQILLANSKTMHILSVSEQHFKRENRFRQQYLLQISQKPVTTATSGTSATNATIDTCDINDTSVINAINEATTQTTSNLAPPE
jgi:hypothetical protein